jgi:hypothetical protein
MHASDWCQRLANQPSRPTKQSPMPRGSEIQMARPTKAAAPLIRGQVKAPVALAGAFWGSIMSINRAPPSGCMDQPFCLHWAIKASPTTFRSTGPVTEWLPRPVTNRIAPALKLDPTFSQMFKIRRVRFCPSSWRSIVTTPRSTHVWLATFQALAGFSFAQLSWLAGCSISIRSARICSISVRSVEVFMFQAVYNRTWH